MNRRFANTQRRSRDEQRHSQRLGAAVLAARRREIRGRSQMRAVVAVHRRVT